MGTFKNCRINIFLVFKKYTGNVESKQNDESVVERPLLGSIHTNRNFLVSNSKHAVFTNLETDESKCHLHSFSEARKSLL